jgi:ATP-binding cassette subfamily B protein
MATTQLPKSKLTRETFAQGIKTIAKYLRPHRRMLVWLTLGGVADAVVQAFVPLVSGKIFDAIIAVQKNPAISLRAFFSLIAIWSALQLGDNVAQWKISLVNSNLSTRLEAEYIANGFKKLVEMPISFHVSKKHGDTTDRISRAASWLENIVGNVLLYLLPMFLSIFTALAIAFTINVGLSLVLIAAILIYSLILWRAVPRLAGLNVRMHKAYNRAYGDTYDALDNIREIKLAATEQMEQKKIWRSFVDRAAAFWNDLNEVQQRLSIGQRVIVTLTQFSIFVISVFLVRNGSITPGQLVAFNGYAAMMLGPFVTLGRNWQVVQNGLTAIVRAEKILDTPTENYQPKNAVVLKKLKGEVEFNNVSFNYKGGNPILKHISFHVRPGQKIALVGESGVGKTTIIDLLAGFYFAQSGKVSIDGTDVRRLDLTAYRSHLGVVPQEPTLFNDQVGKNIAYGNDKASEKDIITATQEAHADDFINNFPQKYKQVVGWRGVKLSIGQKQRIALARAFLRKPDILILDEPTSALDAKSEHLIKTALHKLMEGRTTFIIAHRLSTVREVDTILVLKDGAVAERGNHTELLKIPNGIYRNLFELQTGFTEE